MRLFAAILLGFFASSAQAYYPTLWKFHNPGSTMIYVSCKLPKPYGLSSPIDLMEQRVPAGQTVDYCWSNYWYNDGLGLNPGMWECQVRGGVGHMSFQTSWGDDVQLNLLNGEVSMLPRLSADICY